MKVLVEWSPRTGNREADALADGIAQDLNPVLEVRVVPSDVKWDILLEALFMCRSAEHEALIARSRGTLPKRDTEKKGCE